MTHQQQVPFWQSIPFKLGLFFTALIVACVAVIGYLVYVQVQSQILQNGHERLQNDIAMARKSFEALLQETSNDIALITNGPLVMDYLANPNEATLSRVASLGKAVLESKPNYAQLRILDVQSGYEVFRLDKKNGEILPANPQDLQDKGDRDYFINAIKTPGKYYFSEINLNEEFGKPSLPLTPTLRVMGKISLDTATKALLVINVDLSAFYQSLDDIATKGVSLQIIDQAGQLLYDKDFTKCFGAQLGHHTNFWDEYTQDPISLGITHRDPASAADLIDLHSLDYSQGRYQISFVARIQRDELFGQAQAIQTALAQIVSVVALVALILVWLATRAMSNRINVITQIVNATNQAQTLAQLPTMSKDEIGILAMAFKDMQSRINEQVAALKSSLAREQSAIRDRDEFLQNMSHELRTPLNAILGLTDLLAKNNPSAAQQPIISSLKRSASNLTGLMYDILEYEKLAKGQLKINPTPTDIHHRLQSTFKTYQFDAVKKGLRFEMEADHQIQAKHFVTDPLRFDQIVTNLVVNAIKYTQRGEIRLRAWVEAHDHSQHLYVEVIDTGEGISSDDLQKIKERFYRVSQGEKPNKDGFGLGLSIVKQLVALFNGKLHVESKLDEGSVFRFSIPVEEVTHQPVVLQPPTVSMQPRLQQTYRVFHLEDDEPMLYLVKAFLEDMNIELTQSRSIDKLIALAKNTKPDLLLTDLRLEEGSIAARLQKELIHQLDCPVAVISAAEADEAKQISPYHLQKPFTAAALIDLVQILLGKNEFDQPDLTSIYTQYDHEPTKLKNYLSILQQEFVTYRSRISQLSPQVDPEEWKAISHKMITHSRSLKMPRLESMISQQGDQVTDESLDWFENQIRFLLCCLRREVANLG